MTTNQLVTLTQDEKAAIRAVCPAAVIVSPNFSGTPADVTYMQNYYNEGGPTDLDAATIHIYTNGSAPIDFPESINPVTGHGAYYGNVQALIAAKFPGKPIWMTEGSWNCAGCSTDFTTAAQQAAFILRYYLIQASLGFQRVYWYEYDNSAFGTLYPPLRSDRSTLPQTAYNQTYNWLVGNELSAPCSSPTPTATPARWTCGLTGPSGYQALVAWITQGSQSFTPPSPGTYTQYRDITGAIHPYSGGAVTITISPILFEN